MPLLRKARAQAALRAAAAAAAVAGARRPHKEGEAAEAPAASVVMCRFQAERFSSCC